MIVNEKLPPGWVTKIYPGIDRRVQVADIRTQKGMITHSIVKLVVLPN